MTEAASVMIMSCMAGGCTPRPAIKKMCRRGGWPVRRGSSTRDAPRQSLADSGLGGALGLVIVLAVLGCCASALTELAFWGCGVARKSGINHIIRA